MGVRTYRHFFSFVFANLGYESCDVNELFCQPEINKTDVQWMLLLDLALSTTEIYKKALNFSYKINAK